MTDFTTVLREAGERVTPARIAVLSALERVKRPLSVQNIISEVGKEAIDYVTTYRTITRLKQAGLVRQIDLQHNHAHYELSSLGDHHHVVCTQCNRVDEVLHCNIEHMMQTALQATEFAEISWHSLEFFGLCKKCAV